ncbi:MAG: hypothetical protein H6978_01055 [Gammaproteobacteria bacterium]|nr:hypothetical protein [Gammaproteobacteria bacterium]
MLLLIAVMPWLAGAASRPGTDGDFGWGLMFLYYIMPGAVLMLVISLLCASLGLFRQPVIALAFSAATLVIGISSALLLVFTVRDTLAMMISVTGVVVATCVVLYPPVRQYLSRAEYDPDAHKASSVEHPQFDNVRIGRFGQRGSSGKQRARR